MPWLEEDLRVANDHIEWAQAIIGRQQAIIRELSDGGHDTQRAQTLLRTMRETLVVLVRHKETIAASLDEAAKAPSSAR
jgi:hypothetical protein